MRYLAISLAFTACDSPGRDVPGAHRGCGYCGHEERYSCYSCSGIQVCANWYYTGWIACYRAINGMCFLANGDSMGACRSSCPESDEPDTTCP